MLEKLQMYINGEWVDSHSTETIEVMNPSDDSVLGVITAGNSDDVDKAVAAAKEAFVDLYTKVDAGEDLGDAAESDAEPFIQQDELNDE